MLGSHAPFGAALALCLATASCAAPGSDAQAASFAAPVEVEIEEPLTLSVDALDVRHGSLRIEASMSNGSADVSMWLGDSCERREVGRGIATPAGFAWSLSRDEIARAIECSLVVKARAVGDAGQRVRRVAQLPVSVMLQPDGAEVIGLRGLEARGSSTRLTFVGPVSAARLHVAGTVIGAEADVDKVTELTRGALLSSFVVSNDDLARAMISRRPLTLVGDAFLTTVTVGSRTVDVATPAEPDPRHNRERYRERERDGEGPVFLDNCG